MPNEEGLYKNKYRIKSIRWEGYDYAQEGFYFVTFCTKNREMFFGDIVDKKMVLSELGELAKYEWQNTDKIRKNVGLDEFVIMPNHIHGIIIIKNKISTVETHCNASNPKNTHAVETHAVETHAVETHAVETHAVETHCNASLRYDEYKNKFGSQSNNLSAIIRGFKGAVKNKITKNFPNINFCWQDRFYDRVIRNEEELNKIRRYIIDNPVKWELDRNNPKNY